MTNERTIHYKKLGTLASIQLGLLQEYQVDRLTSFINPDDDVSASAYNANQARIATHCRAASITTRT